MNLRTFDRVKRGIDATVATIGLIISAPLQGVIALLVRRNLGSPVLFRQMRPGKDERLFELIKFRTMRDVDPRAGFVTDEQRLTSFGAVLRSTSLDELPTLWNVVKGDMSLVGPRPLLVQYLDRYSETQRRRHEVRPGITGLAQVSGRNAVGWEEKFNYDIRYVDSRSMLLDLKILAKTLRVTMRRHGISGADHVTMSEFTGGGRHG